MVLLMELIDVDDAMTWTWFVKYILLVLWSIMHYIVMGIFIIYGRWDKNTIYMPEGNKGWDCTMENAEDGWVILAWS